MNVETLDRLEALERAASPGRWEAEHHTHETKTHPYNSALLIFVDGKPVHKLHHSVENTEFVAAIRMNARELIRLARIGLQHE